VDKFVNRKAIESSWLDQEKSQFKANSTRFDERTEYSNIECKYQGKVFWAKKLQDQNPTKSPYFQSKGRWIRIKDEQKSSYVFAIKDNKRDIIQACKVSILLEQNKNHPATKSWIRNESKAIQSEEIDFYARTSTYTSPYPTAISLNKGSNSEYTLKLISK
jgi:hypothetical protein